jgi:hypothetical protein
MPWMAGSDERLAVLLACYLPPATNDSGETIANASAGFKHGENPMHG